MSNVQKRYKVFISYSHADSKWLTRLQVHLKPLEREFETDIWDDTRIKPGSHWKKEIVAAFDQAKVAILLISADFIASDFIQSYELPSLLEKSGEDGVVIIPVILSPSRFERTRLSDYEAVNKPENPISAMSQNDQEKTFDSVAEIIEGVFETKKATIDNEYTAKDNTPKSKGFLHEREIIEVLNASGSLSENESAEKTILIYSTELQQTWLVATRNRVFCLVNENGDCKDEQSISWIASKNSLKPIRTRKYKKYTGLLDLNNHAGWLYTYRLFPRPEDLVSKVNELLV